MDQRSYNNRPVQVGDVINLTIDGVGSKGDGFGKIDNFIVMVPNAKEGETVKVRITRVLRKMAFGELADENSRDSSEESSMEEEPMEDSDDDDSFGDVDLESEDDEED